MGAKHVVSRHVKPIRWYRSTSSEQSPVLVSTPGGALTKVSTKREKESEPRHGWIKVFITSDVEPAQVISPHPLGASFAAALLYVTDVGGS